jgi:hypothetical protein
MRCSAAQLSSFRRRLLPMVHSVYIVLSSACGPASPTLRSCSTCPCCFRGELAAAPMQCIRTVVTDTRSMALAGEPIPPFSFAAHPHRVDGNRYRGHAAHNRQQHTPHTRMARGVQQTAARTAHAAQRAAWRAASVLLRTRTVRTEFARLASAGSHSARGGRSASTRQRTPPATPLRRTRCVRALACACPGGGWRGTLQRVRHVAPAAGRGRRSRAWVRLATRQ